MRDVPSRSRVGLVSESRPSTSRACGSSHGPRRFLGSVVELPDAAVMGLIRADDGRLLTFLPSHCSLQMASGYLSRSGVLESGSRVWGSRVWGLEFRVYRTRQATDFGSGTALACPYETLFRSPNFVPHCSEKTPIKRATPDSSRDSCLLGRFGRQPELRMLLALACVFSSVGSVGPSKSGLDSVSAQCEFFYTTGV